MQLLHVIIQGKVQGVGFRYHTQKKAMELGLFGWVRNLPSGEVEAYAEGNDLQVAAFLKWLHEGPASSRVDAVKCVAHNTIDAMTKKGFEILR